jgi:hypothetical protein
LEENKTMQLKERSLEEAIDQINDKDTREQLAGCLQYLKDHLELVEIRGDGPRTCTCYTCGQAHDRKNRNWKPFKNLEAYCKKQGLNAGGILDTIENAIWRRVECECEILNDRKEVKRRRL